MLKRLAVLASIVLALPAIAAAQANVSVKWISGDLCYYTELGVALICFDGHDRQVVVSSGTTLDLSAATSTFADGSIARAKLTEDALQAYGIPVFDLQQTTGIQLVAAETAGNFNIAVGANVQLAQGEITDNETETSITQFQFVLPPEYVAGGDVKIRLPVAIIKTAAAVDNASTIDCSVYEQASGAIGADLVTTAAQTFAATDTWYNKDFTVDATGLVAGDTLNIIVTGAITDSEAGGGTLRLNLGTPKILLDVKG